MKQNHSVVKPISHQFIAGEITTQCDTAFGVAQKKIEEIVADSTGAAPHANGSKNCLIELEETLADFADITQALAFMKDVHTDLKTREEAIACEEKLRSFWVQLFTRKDLYLAIKHSKATTDEEIRLQQKTIEAFERNGLHLDDDKLNEVKHCFERISQLESRFQSHLNADQTFVLFTQAELTGLPDSVFDRLEKIQTEKGECYKVTTRATDVIAVTENVSIPETRKKISLAYNNRCQSTNPALLKETIQLREKTAHLLGKTHWADYQTSHKMAKTAATVSSFLNDLKSQLKEKRAADLELLRTYKSQMNQTPLEKTTLETYDISYYSNQYRKNKLDLDKEKLREFFPTQHVFSTLFSFFSKLLDLRFNEVTSCTLWHPSARLFEITEVKTGKAIAGFYIDLVPRDGKYGHAAAFTLRQGRKLKSEEYALPLSAIVANFTPPSGDRPSLLSLDEVRTTFHEFGHILHQTLTRAPFASLSGTAVAYDFVETPSQLFEYWMEQPELLKQISKHYKTNEPLTDSMIKKILDAKDFNRGYHYSRQILLSQFDLAIHSTHANADPTDTFNQMHLETLGLPPLEGSAFPGTFGHLMGGYDAGYYGYLWSEVFAADLASEFKKAGWLAPELGQRYRKTILESGNMKDADVLLREFLQREPSTESFARKIQ